MERWLKVGVIGTDMLVDKINMLLMKLTCDICPSFYVSESVEAVKLTVFISMCLLCVEINTIGVDVCYRLFKEKNILT